MSTGRVIKTAFVFAVLALAAFSLTPAGKRWMGRGPRVIPNEQFHVPDAGFSIMLPGRPDEADLSLLMIDPKARGADERTAEVRAFQAKHGTFRGWVLSIGEYRLGVRVQTPNRDFAEEARGLAAKFLDRPGKVGFDVTNFPVLDESFAEVKARKGRLLLLDRRDGRRMLVLLFASKGSYVTVFYEQAGSVLTLKDPNAAEVFNSIVFDPE